MSFDKTYPNRKDRRKQYRGAGRAARGCRPHGGCPYCESNRLHKYRRHITNLTPKHLLFSEIFES